MILSELNYLEPVSENNEIVGGVLTYTGTDSTFSLAEADAGPNGIKVGGFAAALSGANGDNASAHTLTNTYVHDNQILSTAGAMASASSTSLSSGGYDSSNSSASSLYLSSSYREISLNFAKSSSMES